MKREMSGPILIGVVVVVVVVIAFLYFRQFGPHGYAADPPTGRTPMDKFGDPRLGHNPMFSAPTRTAPSTQAPGVGDGR